MKAQTAKTAHTAVTSCEVVAAGGLGLLVALAAVTLVGALAGWPWQAVVLVDAYPAGHLAQLARHGSDIAATARRADQAIRRRINDRTDPRTTRSRP